ncbi:MAG: hypothetical protein AVDCRST_MAG55-856, partial [uncultured Rubrobacteraceae bacterium]
GRRKGQEHDQRDRSAVYRRGGRDSDGARNGIRRRTHAL